MPCDSRPAAIPASTSPEPAVASQGAALALIAARPSERRDHRVRPLEDDRSLGEQRRFARAFDFRQVFVCDEFREDSGEFALMRSQYELRRALRPEGTQKLVAAARQMRQRVGIENDMANDARACRDQFQREVADTLLQPDARAEDHRSRLAVGKPFSDLLR